MTLPDERYRSVERTREFLYSLIEPKKTPRIPKRIRLLAYSLLRHYPRPQDMEQASEKCPEVFSKDQVWFLDQFK